MRSRIEFVLHEINIVLSFLVRIVGLYDKQFCFFMHRFNVLTRYTKPENQQLLIIGVTMYLNMYPTQRKTISKFSAINCNTSVIRVLQNNDC